MRSRDPESSFSGSLPSDFVPERQPLLRLSNVETSGVGGRRRSVCASWFASRDNFDIIYSSSVVESKLGLPGEWEPLQQVAASGLNGSSRRSMESLCRLLRLLLPISSARHRLGPMKRHPNEQQQQQQQQQHHICPRPSARQARERISRALKWAALEAIN